MSLFGKQSADLQIFRSFGKTPAEQLWLVLLSLAGVLIHLLFYSNLGFHRDELLYLSLGEHPDFGYFSVPPLIGILALIVVKIFGYSLFAVKLVPALAGGAMVYLAALTAKELQGSLFSQLLAGTGLICSILFLRTFSLFQPVFLDVFFWTVSFYLLVRYINTNHRTSLFYLGVAIGFGLLNKYNILFLVLAFLVVLPFTRYRKLFISKELYVAVFIAFLMVLPNLIWQIMHQLPVLDHMNELRDSQLSGMSSATFLKDQLLMIFPATLLALPGVCCLLFSGQLEKFRLIGYTMLVVLVLYLLLQGKSYYSAGIYPVMIAAGAVCCERYLRSNVLRWLFILLLLLLTGAMLPMGVSSKPPDKMVAYFDKVAKMTGSDAVRRFEDNKYHSLPQDYADMLGWEELTSVTNKAWLEVKQKEQCLIYAENYGQAGAITILGKQYNLPEAISFSDNFRYWIPREFDHEITTLIYLNDEPGEDIRQLFGNIREVGSVTDPLAREYGTKVFLCTQPQSSFNRFWDGKMQALLQEKN